MYVENFYMRWSLGIISDLVAVVYMIFQILEMYLYEGSYSWTEGGDKIFTEQRKADNLNSPK